MPLRHCCCCLTLLWRSVRAMGRLFGCFRVHDDNGRRRHPYLSLSIRSRSLPREAHATNQLPSLDQVEESDDRLVKDRENLVRRSGKLDIYESELREQARFLKACGVLPETPAEIRKLSKKPKDNSPGHDSEQLTLQSWFPESFACSIHENDKPPQLDPTGGHTSNSCQQSETEISSVSSTPTKGETAKGGCITSVNNLQDVTPVLKSMLVSSSKTAQHKQKSVSFKTESKMGPGAGLQNEVNSEWLKTGDRNTNHRHSPYPTPLKLCDEMQTPATVYNSGNKSKARIRSEHVHGVLNPIDQNLCYWNILEESVDDHSSFNDEVDLGRSHLNNSTPPGCEFGGKENMIQNATVGEASLASWLRPPLHLDDEEGDYQVQIHGNNEEQEVPYISPKRWDINGILNTTTKYNEDQKVKWHATPFEERLEKALSEEKKIFVPKNGSFGQ